MKKISQYLYITLFLAILLLPLLGMTFYQNRAKPEKRILATLPKWQENGLWNQNYLSQLGDYYTDHFAFRSEVVEANAVLSNVLGMSGQDAVIRGKEGFLFYKDSLDSYLGKTVLDERQLFSTVRMLELMEEYSAQQGVRFVFTVAPNKNTLYPQYMPYYYQKMSAESDLDRLTKRLDKSTVPYVDLKKAFLEQDEVLYHKLDSHWNNKGAALAMSSILDNLAQEHVDYGAISYTERKDFEGDLYGMVFPHGQKKDTNIYYQKEFGFSYDDGFRSVEDIAVHTVHESKDGTAVVFRDSFGNSLLPFLAEEYKDAFFSRAVPYQIDLIEKRAADTLIFEIVERHLQNLAAQLPVMPAPIREFNEWDQRELQVGQTMDVIEEGSYLKIAGVLPKASLDVDSEIYVRCISSQVTTVYEAFPLNGEKKDVYGYGLSIPVDNFKNDTYVFELLTKKDGEFISSGYLKTYNIE
jgi:hypothetical protein